MLKELLAQCRYKTHSSCVVNQCKHYVPLDKHAFIKHIKKVHKCKFLNVGMNNDVSSKIFKTTSRQSVVNKDSPQNEDTVTEKAKTWPLYTRTGSVRQVYTKIVLCVIGKDEQGWTNSWLSCQGRRTRRGGTHPHVPVVSTSEVQRETMWVRGDKNCEFECQTINLN